MNPALNPTFSWMAAALFALAALGLRLVAPENPPLHTDEAVNARLLGDMFAGETYRYDPQDKHGPVLSFLTYPVARLQGATSFAELEARHLRLMPALFGAATLLLLPLLRGVFPAGSLLAAALWLTAAAPFVYYGRYWIHETIFVFLTLLLIAAVWRYLQTAQRRWALVAGVCGGLLLATKETVAITGLAGVIAGLGTAFLSGRSFRGAFISEESVRGRARTPLRAGPKDVPGGEGARRPTERDHNRDFPARPARWKVDLVLAAGVGLGCAALFFSSFGAHPSGLLDALRGATRFVARASGEGHEKPWFTYLGWWLTPNLRSWPWGGWTLGGFALVGAFATVRRRRETPLGVFLLLFTLAQLAIYSAIPYKTPWLQLNFLAPGALLGGVGFAVGCDIIVAGWEKFRLPVAAVYDRRRRDPGGHRPPLQGARMGTTLGLFALIAVALGAETSGLCFRFPADPQNPLAYAPTSPDILNLQAYVERYARAQPDGLATVVQVVGDDYWPVPWFLRHFSNVGYWSHIPTELTAPIVISSGEAADEVARQLGSGWTSEIFGVRPEVLVVVFTRQAAPDRNRNDGPS